MKQYVLKFSLSNFETGLIPFSDVIAELEQVGEQTLLPSLRQIPRIDFLTSK
jgi:hypothetical protein